MRLYRIAKAIDSATGTKTMSGEGGLHGSARWHTQGRPIVYTATSQALATLEIAVNLKNPSVFPAYRILEASVPDALVMTIEASMLPADWNHKDGEHLSTRSIRDRWMASRVSAALRVPSAVTAQEYKVLLYPAHAEYSQVTYADPLDFPFDPRIKA